MEAFQVFGIAVGEAARGCAVEAIVGDLYTAPATNLTTIGNVFTAKVTGTAPLKNKVPAGLAPVPFYIDGTPMPNDGTASAGAWL